MILKCNIAMEMQRERTCIRTALYTFCWLTATYLFLFCLYFHGIRTLICINNRRNEVQRSDSTKRCNGTLKPHNENSWGIHSHRNIHELIDWLTYVIFLAICYVCECVFGECLKGVYIFKWLSIYKSTTLNNSHCFSIQANPFNECNKFIIIWHEHVVCN